MHGTSGNNQAPASFYIHLWQVLATSFIFTLTFRISR